MTTSKIRFLFSFICILSIAVPLASAQSTREKIDELGGSDEVIHEGGLVSDAWKDSLNLDYRGIVAKLSSLKIKVDDPALQLDPDLLLYLIGYFRVMGVPDHEGMTIRPSPEHGPVLVKREGKVLWFSTNASQNTLFKKFNAELRRKIQANDASARVTVEFNNTLFEQLTIAIFDKPALQKILSRVFHIELDAERSDPLFDQSAPLSPRETYMILKQLMDLPSGVTQNLKLKRIIRMRPGIKEGDLAGQYSPSEQKIRLLDLAFADGPVGGEGTLLHEMGHAYWEWMTADMRSEYSALSWADGHKIPGKTNFISEYSMKNVYEDFAEHFSAYVNQSEKLKSMAPDKYAFMKKNIFGNVEFKSSGAIQVYISSANPDTKPPYIIGSVENQISLEFLEPTPSGNVMVKVRVEGVFDDLSGVKDISIDFSSTRSTAKKDGFSLYLRSKDCIDKDKGIYESKQELDLGPFDKGDEVAASYMFLTDRANNSAYIALHGQPIQIPIQQKKKYRPDDVQMSLEDQQKIRIEPVRKKFKGQQQAYDVFLPIPVEPDLEQVWLNWWHQGISDYGDLYHFIDRKQVETVEGGMKMRVVFSEEMPPGDIQLSEIDLVLAGNSILKKQRQRIKLGKGLTNFILHYKPTHEDFTKPEFNPNDIEVSGEVGGQASAKNSEGGDAIIYVKVPVRGVEFDKNHTVTVHAVVRSPSGKEIYGVAKVNRDDPQVKNRKSDGEVEVSVPVSLPPNHEQGVYTVQTVDATEEHPKAGATNLPEASGGFKVEAKLLERNIKKTFILSGAKGGGQ